MNEFTKITNGKELIVRKNLSNFLEKVLNYCGYEFRHDIYKQIIYSEIGVTIPFEEKIKSFYDAYYYLLSNHKSELTKSILKKFFYIVDCTIFDDSRLNDIVMNYYEFMNLPGVESAIKFHIGIKKHLTEYDDNDKMIISLMFLNYMFLKKDIPTISFQQSELRKYEDELEQYLNGNKIGIYKFIFEILNKKEKFQDKSYYTNLTDITYEEIYQILLKDKELLMNNYKVKSLSIYGSFSKLINRIDSDIDLIITFSLDLPQVKKNMFKEQIKKHYFNIFNRFIDLTEVSLILNDQLLRQLTNIIKIF